jgi:hypothetical protein
MKIDKVIFTIDDNPHYKGFWSSISKHYKQRMGMTPKLFIIGKDIDIESYDDSNGEIEIVDPVEGVPTIIQALMGKFYFTKTEPETTWLIGDLDLYPLQHKHFNDSIENINEDKYVHLNPHAYTKNWRERIEGLAGYNHVAKGKTFISELGLDRTFEEVVKEIYNSNKWGIKFQNNTGGALNRQASDDWGWFCCEEMYTGFLLRESNKLVEIPPQDGYKRVDRSDMKYDINKVKNGDYIDFHSPRPYENYIDVIETIVSFIPQK